MRTLLFIFCLSVSTIFKVESLQSISVNNVIVNYMDKGTETDYYLISNLPNQPPISADNAWLAVGLNSKTIMNGGIAVVCSNNNGVSKIEHYYLNGNQPRLIDSSNPSIGIKDIRVEINQGYLVCRFTRDNNFNKFIGQIDTGFAYMLVAYGSGSLAYHGSTNRGHTDYKIKIAEPVTLPPQPPTQPPTRPPTFPTQPPTLPTRPPTFPTRPPTFPTQPPTLPTRPPTFPTQPPTFPTRPPTFPTQPPTFPTQPTIIPTRPDDTKGAYITQNYEVYWSNNGSATTYSLSSANGNSPNQWIGMGFSFDQMMGDDSVVICKYVCNNGVCKGSAESRYNNGKFNELADPQNPSAGLSNVRVQLANGRLTCSFIRQNNIASLQKYFNVGLTQSWYLLNARGPTDQNGNVLYHFQREASNMAMVFASNVPIQTLPPNQGSSTQAPLVPVKPLSQTFEEVTQAVLGFFNFIQRLFS